MSEKQHHEPGFSATRFERPNVPVQPVIFDRKSGRVVRPHHGNNKPLEKNESSGSSKRRRKAKKGAAAKAKDHHQQQEQKQPLVGLTIQVSPPHKSDHRDSPVVTTPSHHQSPPATNTAVYPLATYGGINTGVHPLERPHGHRDPHAATPPRDFQEMSTGYNDGDEENNHNPRDKGPNQLITQQQQNEPPPSAGLTKAIIHRALDEKSTPHHKKRK